jgi:predicted flap endonuclease-1-like 5' DNA nuclease
MAKLEDIEGIGKKYAAKLKASGVRGTGDLLRKGATPAGRKEISNKSGVSHTLVLEWVNHVDLYRIKGVGSEYSDLLEEAGVDTIPELQQRKADNLYEKMREINTAKKFVRKLPTAKQVADWINQAKKLRRIITY